MKILFPRIFSSTTPKGIVSILIAFYSLSVNAQTITTIAGNGTTGFSGDGGLATSAQMNGTNGIAFDALGNIYFCDVFNNRIRKISPSGTITTVAGDGSITYAGDGVLATATGLFNPDRITLDAAGNLFIADQYNYCIRKVNPSGIITTVAGTGSVFYNGDGIPATTANLFNPSGIVVDAAGNLYIADVQNHRIRMIDASGIITTIAGNGTSGFSGDGGLATSAQLDAPYSMTFDGAGNLYIADYFNNRIRKVNTAGIITTVVGNGVGGYGGDGGPATAAALNLPTEVAFDSNGNMFIADKSNNRIRVVNTAGIITTLAGNGTSGYNGDNIQASLAELNLPFFVICDAAGDVYIGDSFNNRIRKVTMPQCTGIISASSATICSGNSTTLSAVFGVTNNTYTWSPGSFNTASISISPTITTIYTLYSSTTNTGATCRSITTKTINVVPTPTLTLSPVTTTICRGQTATIVAIGASTYTWLPVNSTFSTIVVNPISTTIYTLAGSNALGCSGTSKTAIVVVAICASVEENNTQSGSLLTIYPNPSTGKISIQVNEINKEYYLIIHDALGREVKKVSLNSLQTDIDLTNYENGLYFISLTDGVKNKFTRRIVKNW
jgi:sugar lactone lactonase YvrE